jgi:hypothetical protein
VTAESASDRNRREFGPFKTERDASNSPAARAVYAAFDADPGVGKMRPHNLAVLIAACEAAGVVLGEYDERVLAGAAYSEPATCAVLAGIIRRAAARPAAAEAEWGVRFTVAGVNEHPCNSEEEARTVVAGMRRKQPEFGAVLIVRVPEVPAGPWTLVPEESPDA